VDIVAAHKDEKMAAIGLTAAASAGVPGASLALGLDKFAMSKAGTADTKAAVKLFKAFR